VVTQHERGREHAQRRDHEQRDGVESDRLVPQGLGDVVVDDAGGQGPESRDDDEPDGDGEQPKR
jgi:hypothetical protein